MTTCRRCQRKRPVSRKRGLCNPCRSWLCQQGKLDDYPPLLPPLTRCLRRPNKRAPLGSAVRRACAALYGRGYSTWELAYAFDTSPNAVADALRWAERHPQ